jgi:hypothetical protein
MLAVHAIIWRAPVVVLRKLKGRPREVIEVACDALLSNAPAQISGLSVSTTTRTSYSRDRNGRDVDILYRTCETKVALEAILKGLS